MPSLQSNRWCFTLNNYTDEELTHLRSFYNNNKQQVVYLIFGFETAPSTNTPHLQGFILFYPAYKKTLHWLKRSFNSRAHYQRTGGTNLEAADYCRKGDNEFEEYGALPQSSLASPLAQGVEWVTKFVRDHARAPSAHELATAFPVLYVRSGARLLEYGAVIAPPPTLVQGTLRPWQQALYDQLVEPCTDDRGIIFYVDEEGNQGKSWFQRYMVTNHSDKVQLLGVGKRDDMCYSVDVSKTIFLINVPRGQMQYFQYSVMEMLKDRCVNSPKYVSQMKFLLHLPHVVVFCNEMPDMNAMSEDRYLVRSDF